MRKTLLALCLLAAVGFGAWRFLAPAPAPKNPMERMKAVSPVEKIREPKATSAAPAPRATAILDPNQKIPRPGSLFDIRV